MHVLPYLKTDCSGSLEVANNSIASATLCVQSRRGRLETFETKAGAVLEMGGQVPESRLAMKPKV